MSFEVDLSEVFKLVTSLEQVATEIYPQVDAVNSRGALHIKNGMIADASASRHFKGLAPSITYEHDNKPGMIQRAIGPDKDRPGGALGNIAYFGTSRGGGSLDIEKPLREEVPKYEKALGDLAEKFGRQL